MVKMKAIGLIALVLTFALVADGHAFWEFGKYTSVEAENGIVTIPVADVDDGAAHYYKYDTGEKEVKFFLLKSSDGVIRAAFDACDVCFLEKKGYDQAGEFMVCNNCGMKFHSSRINVVEGGCNPSPLNRTYDDVNVTIKVQDIVAGGRYF